MSTHVPCPVCNQAFPSIPARDRHIEFHHAPAPPKSGLRVKTAQALHRIAAAIEN